MTAPADPGRNPGGPASGEMASGGADRPGQQAWPDAATGQPTGAEPAGGTRTDPAEPPGAEADPPGWADEPEDEPGEPVPPELVRLAAAVGALDEVAGLPVAEHVPRYDALHGELSDALAAIDEV